MGILIGTLFGFSLWFLYNEWRNEQKEIKRLLEEISRRNAPEPTPKKPFKQYLKEQDEAKKAL